MMGSATSHEAEQNTAWSMLPMAEKSTNNRFDFLTVYGFLVSYRPVGIGAVNEQAMNNAFVLGMSCRKE